MKTLIEHLDELRHACIIICIYLLFFFVIGIIISPTIIRKIINDLASSNITLVSLSPIEFIATQLRVGFLFSLVLVSPIIIYQFIKFIKPGLKNPELKVIKYTLPSFILFFILGILFGYFIFLKVSLLFLAKLSSFANVQNMWSIGNFISYIVWTCLALGLVFELPLVIFLLYRLGVLNRAILKKFRPHFYVLIFVIAAIITPTPDAFNQTVVAIPMIILFEISYWVIR